MWKGVEVKKTKRLTHEELKKQLIKSIVINEVVETNELNKQAEEVQDHPRKQQSDSKVRKHH